MPSDGITDPNDLSLTPEQEADLRVRKEYRAYLQKPLLTDQAKAERLHVKHQLLLVAGGERGGKSDVTGTIMAEDAYCNIVRGKPPSLWWLIGKSYDEPRPEFKYMASQLDKWGLVDTSDKRNPAMPNMGEWRMRLIDGSLVQTVTADDFLGIAKYAPDGIAICEAAQVTYEVFLRSYNRLGEKHGKMILSGCLSGDTLVPTSAGLLAMQELVGNATHPIDVVVAGLDTNATATLAFYNGRKPTLKVSFDRDVQIEGTPDHRVIGRAHDGSVTWRRLDELKPGDLVAIRYGTNLFGTRHIENAYLLGLYIAEGCCDKTDRFTITNSDKPITDYLAGLGYRQHGYHWRKTDHQLAAEYVGLGVDFSWKAKTKQIPKGVREADRESVVAFLQGLFDGDGTAGKGYPVLYTSSRVLADQTRAMLLNLGVPASVTTRHGTSKFPNGTSTQFVDYAVTALDAPLFARLIGFRLERKQRALQAHSPSFHHNQASCGNELFGHPVLWCRVHDVELGETETYDLHVPDGHSYCANGLIVHNTFEGSMGWLPDMYNQLIQPNDMDGAAISLPSWGNKFIYPKGEDDPFFKAAKRLMSAEQYQERFAAVPCVPSNVVHNKFRYNTHVGLLPYNPDWPLELAIDPGWSEDKVYAILFVQWDPKAKPGHEIINVIDEVCEPKSNTRDLIAKCKQKPFWDQVHGGVIDVASKAEMENNSIRRTWREHAGLRLRCKFIHIQPGIDRLNSFLDPIVNEDGTKGRPHLMYDARCRHAIREYGLYRWPKSMDMSRARQVPIDRDNDCIKAITYWVVDEYGFVADMLKRIFKWPFTLENQ